MNSEPKPSQKGVVKEFLRALPARLWHTVSHNWPWKVLSVFLAVCLWAGLISQDPTLTRERVFADVPVTVSGADQLQRNGYVVLNDFDENPVSVRLRVDVPQREYGSVQPSNYSPRIDLSKITSTGVQKLRVLTTSTTSYGTVTDVSPAEVELEVDEYISSYRIPVTINRTGEWPAGFYGTAATINPATVTISGPRTLVEQVASVRVDFDVSKLPAYAGLVRTAVPFVLCDGSGNEVQSGQLQLTSENVILRSILVEQTLYPTKELPLNGVGLIEGQPADGYEVKSVTPTPATIVAAGDPTGLAALDSLFADQPVDVTGATASFTSKITLRKPSELAYLSTDTVTLAIEIGPMIDSRTFANVPLVFEGAGERAVACDIKQVGVTLTGPRAALEALAVAAVRPYVDVAALDDGGYELPVSLALVGADIDDFTYTITPEKVSFTLGE